MGGRIGSECDPKAAEEMVRGGAFLLDVRNPDEYAAAHLAGAVCIPLASLEQRAAEIPTDRRVVVTCQSGKRGEMAAERLRAIGFSDVVNLAGGLQAWRAAGHPVRARRGVIPLERQVRGVAGIFVFAGALAAVAGVDWAIAIPLFVGFMLALSGVTGLCPMLSLLRRMPWNRAGGDATCAPRARS